MSESRRYRILDVLGRGGFGTVYRAELHGDGGFAKEVALKVLNLEVEASPQHVARLRDEARMLGLVRHRALVGVDGLVKLLDRWSVVMEYVDGVSLGHLLQSVGPFPVAIALQVVEEVASGLYAAYTASDRDGRPLNLLHRDVKPSNVQLTRHGEVKLLDFGVARAEFAGREAATGTRMVFGSVPYLAPERLQLDDAHASDVFSLAITFVQLVSGSLPLTLPGDAARHALRVDEACGLVAGVGAPPEIVEAVRWWLAGDPAARPDAREFERQCRALRALVPDLHLRDWAEQAIARHRALHPAEAGELTGMLVTEAPTTERYGQLAQMLGAAVPTTFDDLTGETSDVELVAPRAAPPPPPPAGAPIARSTPAPPSPRSTPPWDPALGREPPALRRRAPPGSGPLKLVIAGLLSVSVLVVVGTVLTVVGIAAGGGAVIGVAVLAVAADPSGACVAAIDGARDDLAAEDVRGMRRAESVFSRAEAACRDGRLGLFAAATLTTEARTLARDGRLTDEDLFRLEQELVRQVSGP